MTMHTYLISLRLPCCRQSIDVKVAINDEHHPEADIPEKCPICGDRISEATRATLSEEAERRYVEWRDESSGPID